MIDPQTHSHRLLRLGSLLFSLTAFAIAANAVPPLVTSFARGYSIPFERFGYVFFAQYIFFASASMLIAFLTRGRNGVSILITALTVSSLLFLSAPILNSFAAVLLWIIPLGFCGGLIETQATILLGREDGRQSGRYVALSQAFFCLGAVVAPQIVSVLLSHDVDWQSGFYIFSSFIGVVAVGAILILPRAYKSKKHKEKNYVARDRSEVVSVGRDRGMVLYLFAAAMLLYVVVEGTLVAWLPAFFETRFGLTPASAARTLSLFWLGLLVGRLAMFFFPKRAGNRALLLTSSIAGTICFTFPAFADRVGVVGVFLFISALLLGPVWPLIVTMVRLNFASEGAVAFVVAFGAFGVAVGPFLSSRFIALYGIDDLFLFILLCGCAFSALLVFISIKTAGKIAHWFPWISGHPDRPKTGRMVNKRPKR